MLKSVKSISLNIEQISLISKEYIIEIIKTNNIINIKIEIHIYLY